MLKVLAERWGKNSTKLKDIIMNSPYLNSCGYNEIVKLTFEVIYNSDETEYGRKLDLGKITEVDDGDYQGTVLYLIPFDTYQPCEYEYIMTAVGYGSCSGCDTLQSIQDWSDEKITENQATGFMSLCKDILVNTIKPYNNGWRNDEAFTQIELEI